MRSDLIVYKEFPGLFHEMHNEPEKEQLINAILHFIQQKKYTIGLTLKPNQEEIVSEKVNTWLQNFPDMKLIKR